MSEQKTCFIIMPLSMNPKLKDDYEGKENHFEVILKHLFVEAAKKAGYKPIPPIAQGTKLIQAWIIKELIQADMVLCDISTWNPNVFFELGVRTVVNKPVCLVKDEKTEKAPFDISSLNYHTYNPSNHVDVVKDEIEKLSQHIINCKDETTNALWHNFAVKEKLDSIQIGDTENIDKQDLMLSMLKEISESTHHSANLPRPDISLASNFNLFQAVAADFLKQIETILKENGYSIRNLQLRNNCKTIMVETVTEISPEIRGYLMHLL